MGWASGLKNRRLGGIGEVRRLKDGREGCEDERVGRWENERVGGVR